MALFAKPNLINMVWSSGGDRVAPDTVKISIGWLAEIPPRQTFNFIDWKQDQMLAYINQHGIVEWDNETEYHANKSIVQGSDGNVYQCLVTGVNINPVVDQSSRWRRVAIEEAPRDGRQFVRRNNAWQELDSTAFAPAVHTHQISQIVGLQNALNNKLDITGTNPTLNSTGNISLRLTSVPSESSNFLVGRTGDLDNWYVGKGNAASNNISIHSYILNTTITLQSDRVVSNKNLYVGNNPVFHDGLRPKWNQIDDKPAYLEVPRGVITMWFGTTSNIPAGWALCDGGNGTPDLRDRFVIAAGGGYSLGSTGAGSIPSHTHGAGTLVANSAGAHTHSGSTSSAGAHAHSASTGSAGNHSHTYYNGRAADNNDWGQSRGIGSRNTTSRAGPHSTDMVAAGAHTHTVSIGSAGAHTHTLSVNSGGAHTHGVGGATAAFGSGSDVIAKYHALCYIMKL